MAFFLFCANFKGTMPQTNATDDIVFEFTTKRGRNMSNATTLNNFEHFLQSTVKMCTVASATVGAAAGQLVAGLTHVIAYGSLDE